MNLEQHKAKDIESFLPCVISEAQAAVRWNTKQSIGLQIYIQTETMKKYLVFRKNYPEMRKEVLSYVAVLFVNFKIYDLYKKMHRKNPEMMPNDLVLFDMFEEAVMFQKSERTSKKYEYLKRKQHQILKWRDAGYSLREIASRLLTINGETISYEYLRKFLNNIQIEEI